MDVIESSSMYKVRPVIKLAEGIELPKCMYKMKIIQISHSIDDQQNEINLPPRMEDKEPNKEIDTLEDRQEAILAQLLHLKQQLQSLRVQLSSPPELISTPQDCSDMCGFFEEVVVKANPNSPPYSILAFDNLLKNGMNIHCSIHSGTRYLNDNLKHFERNSTSPVFNILLIWKTVHETEFLVSPTKHSVIKGEVNLLRFLSRYGPLPLNYESNDNPATTCIADDLLDSCHRLSKEKFAKARKSLLKTFTVHLKKNIFLMGNSVSVVDIALWSTLKQLHINTNNAKEIPTIINTWFINCNKIFGTNIP